MSSSAVVTALANGDTGAGSGTTISTPGNVAPVGPCYLFVGVDSFILFGGPNTPTISGGGLTYNLVRSDTYSTTGRHSVFWAFVPAGTAPFIVTASFAAQNQSGGIDFKVAQINNVAPLASGSPFRQAVNANNNNALATVNLALMKPGNAGIGYCVAGGSGPLTERAGWTSVYNLGGADAMEWRQDTDTAVSYTLASNVWVITGLEINVASRMYKARNMVMISRRI